MGICTIIIYSMFWLVYILHLYLTLIYPLKTSRINKLLTSKVTHVTEVIAVITIVTLPNIYFLVTSQYQIVNFPPLFCAPGVNVNFYGFIFPTVVINCTSLILMLLVLHKIHSVSLYLSMCVYACLYSYVYACLIMHMEICMCY